RIVQHQELGIEQPGQLRSALPRYARSNIDQLLPRMQAPPLEARQLVIDAARCHVVPEGVGPLNQDHGAARDHAGRHADSDQAPHAVSSPNPDATSATNASTAPPSSSPSAVMVMVEPHAA